jgi:hypothetical protein
MLKINMLRHFTVATMLTGLLVAMAASPADARRGRFLGGFVGGAIVGGMVGAAASSPKYYYAPSYPCH